MASMCNSKNWSPGKLLNPTIGYIPGQSLLYPTYYEKEGIQGMCVEFNKLLWNLVGIVKIVSNAHDMKKRESDRIRKLKRSIQERISLKKMKRGGKKGENEYCIHWMQRLNRKVLRNIIDRLGRVTQVENIKIKCFILKIYVLAIYCFPSHTHCNFSASHHGPRRVNIKYQFRSDARGDISLDYSC